MVTAFVEIVDVDGSLPGVQIQQGDLLSSAVEIVNQTDNAAGYIQYAASLQVGGFGVSGGGVLARIILRGVKPGQGRIGYTHVVLLDSQWVQIPVKVYGGSIMVNQ